MNCPGCGQDIAVEDAFCKHCGRRLDGAPKQSLSAAVDDMEREYRQWLNEKPRDADAHYNVGLANLYSGNYAQAVEAFLVVVELLPDEASGYAKLAIALAKLGRREEALARARHACRLDPESEAVRRLVRALGG
ncbi:MAG: tetratricopeptide repeat protein [Armatimonadetes bacterium]|nr:tetratricopeptide repeat protein [Armatimonadota bacterium]